MRSFAIVTTSPNELLAELHDRMPVILAPDHWPAWLGERAADLEELKSFLRPYPADDMADDMIVWPVDRRVGNVSNKDPSLIEPASVP
ncbi:MAG TPA: SOS response-associated peptidase family protein [Stellaceae bacterium]|nr:SOS response-associated peptidase family protein [Stellaceae bacterium]